MQNQKLGAQRQSAFQFPTKSCDGLAMKLRRRAGQVHQIIGVNHQRFQIVAGAQPVHFGALWLAKLVRSPLPWAGREDLKRIASQAIGSLRGILHHHESTWHGHANPAAERHLIQYEQRRICGRPRGGQQQEPRDAGGESRQQNRLDPARTPGELARRLVVRGFFGEILQKITVPEVRERLTAAIEAELEAVGV